MNLIPTDNIKLVLNSQKDQLFESGPFPVPFEFNNEVVQVFDDMVSRSVPLYREVNEAIVHWAYLLNQENSNIYDVGCSTGTNLCALAPHLPFVTNLVGIDNSKPMLEKASEKLSSASTKHKVELIHGDALDVEYRNASFTIMNYTLQFIPIKKRLPLLKKIAEGTEAGGGLFMSEKLRSPNPFIQESITRIYENFKVKSGYSKNEVERKKEALDRVLIPLTESELISMLHEAGFTHVEMIMRWNNFASFIALK